MSRHETRYCYNMGSNGQICSKLHKYDKRPGMNTPTWHSRVRVTAPPSGDGKSQRVGSYTVRRGRTFSTSSAGRPLATRWRPRQAPSCVGCEGPFNAACSFNCIWFLDDNQVVGCLKSLYCSPTARIKVNGNLTKTVSLERGCCQGCPLSPTLFALFIQIKSNQIKFYLYSAKSQQGCLKTLYK